MGVKQSMLSIGGSRTTATSKLEHFVIIVSCWKTLTIIIKSSILDVAAVLDPPLGESALFSVIAVLLFNTEKCTALQILPAVEFPFNTLSRYTFLQNYASGSTVSVFSARKTEMAPQRTRILLFPVLILKLWEALSELIKIKTQCNTNYFNIFLEHNFQKQPFVGVLGKGVLKIYSKCPGD